ncbi:MAG: hypothetical protein WC250_01370, partial [Candidatus Paceibacterota bacterium]
MKKSSFAPFIVMVVVMLGIFGAFKILLMVKSHLQKKTSDAKDVKAKITLAYDDWIGYFPVSSGRMKKFLRNEGYLLECQNDGADYQARNKNLRDGKLDFAVMTVDSEILNAAAHDFPATIIMVIDESKGDDAIVAYTNLVQNLDSLKSGVSPRIAYTQGSPSHQLLKTVASHFNVPALKNLDREHRFETKDSQEALRLLQSKKVSMAILWEPNVSKALQIPGVGKIIGTESISRAVVDILVVNREFATKYPERVDLFLKTYFRVLKFYADNPEEFKKDIHDELKVPKEAIQTMLDGVRFVNLSENCQEWFGVSGPGQIAEQGLVDTIGSTVSILLEAGDFKESPLPDKDPYRIINSTFITAIYQNGLRTGFASLDGGVKALDPTAALARSFKVLTPAQWSKLRSVGSIRVDPIIFQTGSSELGVSEKEKLDAAVER